jgi:hypothetical protein
MPRPQAVAAAHDRLKSMPVSKLTYKRNTANLGPVGILTVRLTEEEERVLERRSRAAGMKKATFVRQLIRDKPFETAEDVLEDFKTRLGDKRLRVVRR